MSCCTFSHIRRADFLLSRSEIPTFFSTKAPFQILVCESLHWLDSCCVCVSLACVCGWFLLWQNFSTSMFRFSWVCLALQPLCWDCVLGFAVSHAPGDLIEEPWCVTRCFVRRCFFRCYMGWRSCDSTDWLTDTDILLVISGSQGWAPCEHSHLFFNALRECFKFAPHSLFRSVALLRRRAVDGIEIPPGHLTCFSLSRQTCACLLDLHLRLSMHRFCSLRFAIICSCTRMKRTLGALLTILKYLFFLISSLSSLLCAFEAAVQTP